MNDLCHNDNDKPVSNYKRLKCNGNNRVEIITTKESDDLFRRERALSMPPATACSSLTLLYVKILILLLIAHLTQCESNITSRIVNGVDAERDEFPFMVAISTRSSYEFYHTCGGTYIHRFWVLTAAHCIIAPSWVSYRVTIGSLEYEPASPHVHDRIGEKRIAHSGFVVEPFPVNDIGLIKINYPFGGVSNLATIPHNFSYAADTVVCAIGFGATQPSDTKEHITKPDKLQKLMTKITEPKHNFDTDSFFVGEYLKNVCYGDSGSAVVCNGSVIGIISAVGRTPKRNCEAVFARIVKVVNYNDWIITTINNTSYLTLTDPVFMYLSLSFYILL